MKPTLEQLQESTKELLAILNKHNNEMSLSAVEVAQKNKAYKLLKELTCK